MVLKPDRIPPVQCPPLRSPRRPGPGAFSVVHRPLNCAQGKTRGRARPGGLSFSFRRFTTMWGTRGRGSVKRCSRTPRGAVGHWLPSPRRAGGGAGSPPAAGGGLGIYRRCPPRPGQLVAILRGLLVACVDQRAPRRAGWVEKWRGARSGPGGPLLVTLVLNPLRVPPSPWPFSCALQREARETGQGRAPFRCHIGP